MKNKMCERMKADEQLVLERIGEGEDVICYYKPARWSTAVGVICRMTPEQSERFANATTDEERERIIKDACIIAHVKGGKAIVQKRPLAGS